ncbi:unnamed protein product, partial [Meganyctiphanes norvegica]
PRPEPRSQPAAAYTPQLHRHIHDMKASIVLVLVSAIASLVLTSPLPQELPTQTAGGIALGQPVIIPYSYGYEVQDAATQNFQNKAEIKTENGDVFGSYSQLMPDGKIYTTTYNVTGNNGYRATLRITDPGPLPSAPSSPTAQQQQA